MQQPCVRFTTFVCFPITRIWARGAALAICVFFTWLLLPALAVGQIAYVTDYPGQHIFAVSKGRATAIIELSRTVGAPVQVRVGGDSLLYVITSKGNILRLTQRGTNLQEVFSAGESGPTGFTGIRFDFAGNLYANTPSGVFVIPGVVQPTPQSSFARPTQLTTASCSSAGDLAFTADGNLLIACQGSMGTANGALFECSASSLPNHCTPKEVPNISGPVIGLAVDSLGDIITSVAGTSTITVTGTVQGSSSSSVNFGEDVPAYLEAVPDPPGTFDAVPEFFPCNSASPSILVSTTNSETGKVWVINTVLGSTILSPGHPLLCPSAPLAKPVSPLVTLDEDQPAVGLAAPATLQTLTKIAAGASRSVFNYGSASLDLFNNTVTNPCDLSMTKGQFSQAWVANRLANLNPPVTAVTFEGEQSWVTGFHGAYSSDCGMDPSARTHIGISGFYSARNPHIVLIPDNPESSVTVDELPSVYPVAPLLGSLGDLYIVNSTTPGVFTTTPTTIVVGEVAFRNGTPTNGYVVCGFEPTLVEDDDDHEHEHSSTGTGKEEVDAIRSGQKVRFKFQLGAGSCSNLVPNAIAEHISTRFSVAQFLDAEGTQSFKPITIETKGDSDQLPSFRYDREERQFIFKLRTKGFCNGSYEATASGDSFPFQMLTFKVVDGGC